jgi:hypothetical protein
MASAVLALVRHGDKPTFTIPHVSSSSLFSVPLGQRAQAAGNDTAEVRDSDRAERDRPVRSKLAESGTWSQMTPHFREIVSIHDISPV